MIVFSIFFWSFFATLLACVEVEAEGKHGWAEKMPTWYRVTGLPARLYGLVMGGKPLTGYHVFVFLLPIFIFHAHFTMGVEWSIAQECESWAMYFSWCVLWDYLWFVLNPHYQQGRFRKEYVWWHAKSYWICSRVPADYPAGILTSLGFALASAFLKNDQEPFFTHVKILIGFGVYTAALHLLAPLYHRWYWRMRARDERDKADIFHGGD